MAPTRISIFIVIVSMLGATQQQQPDRKVNPQIPDYLLECYENQTLYDRDQRLPSTISTLISIVRKIEQYPGITMDLRTFTVSLVRKFKLDGVIRDPLIKDQPGLIPYGPSGRQIYRMKYLFEGLMPASGMNIPNDTLTSQEKCALHFMLSSSIDEWDRGDDGVCGQLYNYKSRRPRSPLDEGEESSAEEDAEEIVEKTTDENDSAKDEEKEDEHEQPVAVDPPHPEELHKEDTNSSLPVITDHASQASEEKDAVESEEGKEAHDIGVDVKVKSPSGSIVPIMQRSGKLMAAPNPSSEAKFAKYSTNIDYRRSECPVENGVVYTPSGAVSAGVLLAGIAAGLQPENVSVVTVLDAIAQGGKRVSYSSSKEYVTNYWAATLAGDLAEAAIYQGPHYDSISIGGAGGWNDTAVPKWYFIKQIDYNDMTEAEIRGGLDGLIIAKNIVQWNSDYGNSLRLSQILDMYYSDRGMSGNPSYKACLRKQHYTEVARSDEIKAEVMGSMKMLKNIQSYISITDELLSKFADNAISKLNSYQATMDPNCATSLPLTYDTQQSQVSPVAVDIVVILDTTWPYKDALTLLSYLLEKLDLGEYGKEKGVGGAGGSRFTLFAGKDPKLPPIVNSTTSPLEFHGNFTYDTYSRLAPGLDIIGSMTRLRTLYAWAMEDERNSHVTTGRPQVALFIPYMSTTMSDSEKSSALNIFKRLRIKAPNTWLMYLSLGSKEQYNDFVIEKDKDLFQISSIADFQSSVQPLLERLAKLPRRIINPACTYRWESNGDPGTSTQYADPMAGPLFFKVHPNYFFKSDKVIVKFQGQGAATLNVCFSRNDDLTGQNTTSSSGSKPNCKSITSDTVEFSESQPCSGTDYISSCKSMYFSVSASNSIKGRADPYARYPDMAPFTVTHEGFTCTNGATGILRSGLLSLTSLWVVLFSMKEMLNRMLLAV